MPRKWELQIGNAVVMPRKNYENDFALETLNRYTLQAGIQLVMPMVEAAIEALDEIKDPGKDVNIAKVTGGRVQTDGKVFEVWDGLNKYFNLTFSDDKFDVYVEGIRKVFELIKVGLSNRYEIVIFHPSSAKYGKPLDQTVGVVSPVSGETPKVRLVGPLRKLFGFPDEWNHLPWRNFDVDQLGKIHLSLAYVNGTMSNQDEHIARTIIHEASHKFARTSDVLYKSAAFYKNLIADDAPPDPKKIKQADMDIMKWKQTVDTRFAGDRSKTFNLMSGASGDDQIDSVRLLENADSYAWFARRMWKRFRKVH